MHRPATRADVARHAGVSTAVVSYVVNDGPRTVAPETAARVRAAIADLHYRPNANARALRKGTTEMLGLVLPDISNPFFAEYALAVELAAARSGYMVVVANTDADPAKERQVVADLGGRHVDALIISTLHAPAELAEFRYSNRPTVIINSATAVPGYLALGPDACEGARTGVDHLLSTHGFRSVVLVMGASNAPLPEPREQGWTSAFRDHGLPPGPIVRTGFSRRGGYAAAQEILSWSTRPEAVFAASDQQASGILAALYQAGLRCPEDVAVVAYDGTSESEYCSPPLTVVRQPITAMAEAAVAAVLGSDRAPAPFVQFATELVIRASCGCGARA